MSTSLTKAGNPRKRDAREGEGRPTKYNQEIARQLAERLTYEATSQACDSVGIDEKTYYSWLHKHDEFLQLSIQARKTKAIKHFTCCEEILEEVKDQKGNPEYRSDLARLRLDFHLRLAGKANQGLFGDKITTEDISKKEPVSMNITLNSE